MWLCFVQVQKVMAGMADRGATACVLECSSIGLDQGRVDLVDLDVAIFTNLGRDHLDYHEDSVFHLSCRPVFPSQCCSCSCQNFRLQSSCAAP